MGNHRFRFSHMIPNAWFFKIKDVSRGKKRCNSHSFMKQSAVVEKTNTNSQHRHTYYYSKPNKADKFYSSPINPKLSDIHFPDFSPRKSSKKRCKRRTIYRPSPKLLAEAHSSVYSYSTSPDLNFLDSLLFEQEEEEEEFDDQNAFVPRCSFDHQVPSCSCSRNCKACSSSSDIIIDVKGETFGNKIKKIDEINIIPEIELRPILTKPTEKMEEMAQFTKLKKRSSNSKLNGINWHTSLSTDNTKQENRIKTSKVGQRRSSNSMGIRLRANSPRFASRKVKAIARKSTSSRNKTLLNSFAVVKSSTDPQKDFKDSMMEMILENNILWSSKDLEDLLACYLSLNSTEYHQHIVKAFEQIWYAITDLRL